MRKEEEFAGSFYECLEVLGKTMNFISFAKKKVIWK